MKEPSGAEMWIVKGILLGVVIFLVAGISYAVMRLGIARFRLYRLTQSANTGTSYYYKIAFHVRGFMHQPIILAALFISIAIGIWIVRARMPHP
jgi:hypothetical protein